MKLQKGSFQRVYFPQRYLMLCWGRAHSHGDRVKGFLPQIGALLIIWTDFALGLMYKWLFAYHRKQHSPKVKSKRKNTQPTGVRQTLNCLTHYCGTRTVIESIEHKKSLGNFCVSIGTLIPELGSISTNENHAFFYFKTFTGIWLATGPEIHQKNVCVVLLWLLVWRWCFGSIVWEWGHLLWVIVVDNVWWQ